MAYTPYLQDVAQTLTSGYKSGQARQAEAIQNKLAGNAYMGDPLAMQELMRINPELGMKIDNAVTQKKNKTAQQGMQKRTEFQKEYKEIISNIAKFNSFEEAKQYGDAMIKDVSQRYPEIMEKIGADAQFDENDFALAKQLAGSKEKQLGDFAGTGMEAQVSNMLTRGVEEPSFRNTPEYARAWQLANEPKVIRTPTGDITMRPELSPVFKPPGSVKSEEQQIDTIKKGVKKDIEVIPGTEKEEKTTADEKISFGYYNRMIGAEDSIAKLGNFDSASIWERFKGVTNITASPELQQYRQAADDWIRAKLRRESGAVIAPPEMQKEYEIYFPQIGDSQAVMDQKKKAREEAQRSMKTAAGKEFKKSEANNEKVKPVVASTISESNLTATVDGKTYKFPTLEALQKYKEAAGL